MGNELWKTEATKIERTNTTGATAAITGVGVEVCGAEIEPTIMEVVLGGEALLQGAGEEEEVPLQLQLQLAVLVQELLQDLGAPGGAEVPTENLFSYVQCIFMKYICEIL